MVSGSLSSADNRAGFASMGNIARIEIDIGMIGEWFKEGGD